MVSAAFCFATMSCIAHGFRGEAPWPLVTLARISVTCLFMHVLVRARGIPLVVWDRALWWRAAFGAGGLVCNFYALSRLPVTDVVTIMSTTPIWVMVILAAYYRKPMPAGLWAHAALAAGGVYIMNRPAFDTAAVPLLIACGGAVIIAGAKVALSRCAHVHPAAVVTHYATFSTGVALVLTLTVPDANVAAASTAPGLWWWMLPMGMAGTMAQMLLTQAYGRGSTSMVALVSLSQIPFAALYDRLVWGYSFDGWKVAGILIIACAITLSIRAGARAAAVREALAGAAPET